MFGLSDLVYIMFMCAHSSHLIYYNCGDKFITKLIDLFDKLILLLSQLIIINRKVSTIY